MSEAITIDLKAVTLAREELDAHVRDIVGWHFNPDTGCPFWLDYAARLDFDPREKIKGYADLKLLGNDLLERARWRRHTWQKALLKPCRSRGPSTATWKKPHQAPTSPTMRDA